MYRLWRLYFRVCVSGICFCHMCCEADTTLGNAPFKILMKSENRIQYSCAQFIVVKSIQNSFEWMGSGLTIDMNIEQFIEDTVVKKLNGVFPI